MWSPVYIVIFFLLASCIFISNLIVLMAIIKSKQLHTPSNMFVAGMALADLSVGAIGLALRFVVSLNLTMDYHICLYLNCQYLYTLYLSLYMLLAFTFDRLYAIRFPLKYRQRVRCKGNIIALSAVWIVGLVEALVPTLLVKDNQLEAYEGLCSFEAVMPLVYVVIVNFFGKVVGGLLILLTVNTYILCVLGRYKRSKTIANRIGRNNMRKKDLKAEKMLIGMIAAYIICSFPINIVLAIKFFGGHVGKGLYREFILYVNAFLNPCIYAASNTGIKKACKNIILCRPLNRIMSDGQRTIESGRSTKTPAMTTSNYNMNEISGNNGARSSTPFNSANNTKEEGRNSQADRERKETLKTRCSSLLKTLSEFVVKPQNITENNDENSARRETLKPESVTIESGRQSKNTGNDNSE